MQLTIETFSDELKQAMACYDKHVVCLDKTSDQCEAVIRSLIQKAINAYANREPNQRHGIAVDPHITVILSQSHGDRPMCGIYFNLSSPYSRLLKAG